LLGVAEQHVGVEGVLLRARGRRLRHGRGLSTVTRTWRPEMARGVVARARKATKEEKWGRDRGEMTRGHVLQLEVELGVLCRRSAAEADAASREGSGVPEEDEAGRCQGD
jgi:hypothetical protein